MKKNLLWSCYQQITFPPKRTIPTSMINPTIKSENCNENKLHNTKGNSQIKYKKKNGKMRKSMKEKHIVVVAVSTVAVSLFGVCLNNACYNCAIETAASC